MARNQISAGGPWTDSEKMRVFFSGFNPNWADIYVPPGRTLKAVRHMVDGERKKLVNAGGAVSNGSAGGDQDTFTPNKANRTRGSRGGTKKGVEQAKDSQRQQNSTSQSKKGAGKRKRDDEAQDVENGIDDDDDQEVKKIKQELQDVLGENQDQHGQEEMLQDMAQEEETAA